MIAKLTHQRLTKTNSKLFNSLLFVFCFFSALNYSFANVTTTKATGGTISCDKAANGTTPTFTVLGNIVITENVATDFSAGTNVTLSVNAPSGWIFDSTSVTGVVNVSFTAAMNITSAIVTSITSSIITITYTVVGTTKLDVMTISGIAVMPIEGGNPGVAVNLTKGGTGVIAGLASAGRVGVLSETVGAGKLYITLPGQTFVNATTFAGSGATGTPTQQTSGTAFSLLKLIDCDQFYNIITTYTGTKTISYSGASNGVTSPIFTTSLSFTSGQSTTTLTTTLKKAESISISATDGVLPAHPSTVLIVNPAVLNNFLVEDGNGGVVTSKSAGVSFNINVSARDVENNILSSGPNIYSGNCTLTSTGVLTSGGGVTSSFTAGVLNNYAVTIRPGGTFTLTAKNGTPTGVSNSFVVNNPYPTITTISPSCLARGALNFTLTVNGSNFNEASIVQLDGVSKTTTYISSTQLTASILASDVGSDGIKNISVSNPTPSGGVSSNASMTVSLTPVISSQPSSLSLCIGSSATFQVTASGFGISYQWKKNGVALVNGGTISGATSNVLTISSVALSDTSSSYIVEISSPCYSLVTSIAVSLNIDVLTIGGIVSGSTSVCSSTNSGSLTLSGFTGSILYWEFSLNNFSSAGTTIANTTSSQSYSNLTQTTYYRAVVKSGVCSIDYSSVAAVTVNALPAVPPNPTASSPQCMGNNVTLTRANTSGGIGYFWQITSAGTSMIDSNLTKIVSASGIYYLRTQNISSGCWSNGVGSVNVNLLASSSSSRSVSICNGSSTTLPDGLVKTSAGVYVSHIANAAGCDSMITTTLIVIPNTTSTRSVSICNGSSTTLPDGLVKTSAGVYISHIANEVGCDSMITTTLIVIPNTTSTRSVSICNGSSTTFPDGSVASTAGVYISHIANAAGCDSTITTTLTVIPNTSSTRSVSICNGSSTTLPDGSVASTAGIYVSHIANAAGCDSTITTTLIVIPNTTSTRSVSICNGSSTTLPDGLVKTSAGVYISHIANAAGCDSTITTTLTVIPNTTSTRSVSICNGSSTTLPDGLIKTLAGVYVSHIANAAGCDSTIMTTISILNNSFSSATQILNNGSTVTLPNGTVVSSAGTYTSTIPNYLGCDSVITTLVIAASSVSSSTTISSCKGDTIILPNGNSVAPIVPTDYVSTLTNASIYGTDSIITTHVLIKALPILSVTTTQILCYGGTASVSLSTTGGLAPYTYGQTPIVGLYQGAYTYYVTDANQCRNTVVTVVNPSPALLVLNATSNQIQCYAGKGSVTLQGVGGTPNYVYSGSALVNLLLGTYNYLVTDNKGCVATASAIILPAPTRLTGTILASPTSCIGNTGSATVNVAGGSPTYTYSWNTIPVQHTSIASNLAAGNYICTITDSRGCNLNAPTVVTNPALPKILFTGKTAFCPGAATTICATAGMTKYLWSNGDTTLCSSFSAIGVYSVTVTNSAGCTSSGSISIVAGGLPISTITGPDYICPGGSTTLSAPPGYTYQWIPSGTKQFLSVRTGGTYTVTIKNSAGCTSSSSKVVTSPLKVSINRLNGSCASAFLGSMSAVIAGGVPPYNYAWSNGATTSSISGLKVGSYNLQVVDSKGCMAVVASTITSVKAAIDYSRLVDAFNNNDIPLGRYIWFSAVVNIIYTGSYPVEIKFTDQNIASSRFNVNPKNARLIIDSTVTQATTVFSNSEWLTIAPPSSTGNYFISGYSYKVPTTILRNLSSVTWKGIWSASSQGVTSINWKWSAAVYSNFNTDCSLLGIKPVDDAINSSYLNMDPAGSPENYTLSVIQGARGNGNGDFVGTYTSVVTRTPCTNSSIVFARNNYNPTIQEELDPDFVVNAYPNPFTSQATIEFSRLDKTCETTIEIFNMSGQKIALLFQGTITSGEKYSTIFDGENLPEGIYIYRIATNDQVINGRLVLTK